MGPYTTLTSQPVHLRTLGYISDELSSTKDCSVTTQLPPRLLPTINTKMALTGKVALITGGVKNLGAQSALELADVGANLALHYHSAGGKKDAAILEAKLKEKNPSIKAFFYQGDLTSVAAVKKLFQDVLRDFGHVDIVINTVGKVLKKPITEISEEEYDTMFAYVVWE